MTRHFRDSRIYGIDQISEFLAAVDRHLSGPVSVTIIGGAAAAFHGAESTTTDVDTRDALDSALEEAVRLANAKTGLAITVSHAAVGDVPWNSEDRLERVLPDLEHLRVWVLEKHDLALSKCVRCAEHDLQQLEELHCNNPLQFDTLVERFRTEMGHAMGDAERRRRNFLDMIERLFGEMKRLEADRQTKPA